MPKQTQGAIGSCFSDRAGSQMTGAVRVTVPREM